MCLLCGAGLGHRIQARRAYVLQLLALVEHPDALPSDAALRLGQEILALTRPDEGGRRCEAVVPPGSEITEAG